MCSLSHSNSLTRVRSVQRLLDELELDGLMCIPGVDSNYNDACWRLYCYLMCDLSGDELEQLELGPSAEEEDTFLLITPNGISVYCHPSCYDSISTRLGRWHPGLCLFCDLSYPDPEDTDHFEVYKVAAFIQMTEGLRNLGVPFGAGFSEMSVEQWPLVQAYALEEMGGRGFFTRTHRVRDVSSGLERLFSEVDPLSASYLQRRGARLFCKQWEDLVEGVSSLDPGAVSELTEQGLLGGMRTYLQHARLSRQAASRAKGYAYLLIGQNSQKLKYKPCPVASSLATVGTSDGRSHQCVVELSDPLLPLAAARTFFFTQNHAPYHPDASLRTRSPDSRHLLGLYRQLVREVRTAIQGLCRGDSLAGLRESVSERLGAQVAGTDIGIDVSVAAYNLYKVELFDTDINHKNVYYLKVILTDILSPENPTKKLGAIVFGESFMLSSLQIASEQGPARPASRCLLLSGAVPLLVVWADRESQLLDGNSLRACLQTADSSQLGNLISLGINDIPLSTSYVAGLVFPVKLHVLSKGLLLQNSVWKFIWLPWILIEKIKLIEGSDEEKHLQIFPQEEFSQHLPEFLLQPYFSVCFSPTGADTHKLCRDTVRFLKSIRAEEDFFTSHQTDSITDSQSVTDSGVTTDISQHLEISWLYDSTISPETLSALTLSNRDTNPSENKVTVHIVAGLPGSNADSLATLVIEQTQGNIAWVLMRPDDHLFNREEFQSLFQTRVEECVKKQASSDTECRVMLVSPCFSAPSQALAAVLSHPSALVRERVRVAGVTLCIGVSSSFSMDEKLHPLIMHSIRPGVISSIILTGFSPGNETPQYTRRCSQLLSLCRRIPTGAGVIQTAHVGKLSAEDLACILSADLFHKLGAVRSWYNPSLYTQDTSEPIVSIEHRSIRCRHHLSQALLTTALSQLPANVQYARGVVDLSSDAPLYHHVEMALSHVQLYPISVYESPPDTSGISFYGRQLGDTDLLSVVQSCLPADKQKVAAKLEPHLTREELAEVESRCRDAPLPEGVFFNGHQYVGFDGERWERHPCRGDIVSQFLSELNGKIESHNREIDILYRNIFSY